MRTKLRGGPFDGKDIVVNGPYPSSVMMPMLAYPMAVWVPEHLPWYKVDEDGNAYYYCEDGKYRTQGFIQVTYRHQGGGHYQYESQTSADALEWKGD